MNVAEHLSNVTQEQEFLGALITFPEAARVAANIMEPAYFYEASHARIFEAIKARLTEGGTVTPTALASHLREEWNKPFLNDMTFGKYVSAMIANSAPAVSVASYAQDLKRLWALRSVYQAAVTPAGRDGELRAQGQAPQPSASARKRRHRGRCGRGDVHVPRRILHRAVP